MGNSKVTGERRGRGRWRREKWTGGKDIYHSYQAQWNTQTGCQPREGFDRLC